MIVCPKCSKENQDHYKFCLGCGAELPRDAAPKQFSVSHTPPQGVPAVKPGASAAPGPAPAPPAPAPPAPAPAVVAAPKAAPVAEPFVAPRAAAAPIATPAPIPASVPAPIPATAAASAPCVQCGGANPPGIRFCMSCGFNLASFSVPPPAAPAGPVAGGPTALLTALRADKSEVGSFTLNGTMVVGRDTGGIFAGDSYLSPKHATFTMRNGHLSVRDENSLNGTFVKLEHEAPVELRTGDMFRIGQEIVRFEALAPQPASPDGVERLGSPAKGYVGRLALVIGRDVTGNAFPVPESGVHLGRERGDILFPEDGYVSGLHCRIRNENGKVFLTDLGSSNGTFLRLTTQEADLRNGDEILMGQQLFRVNY